MDRIEPIMTCHVFLAVEGFGFGVGGGAADRFTSTYVVLRANHLERDTKHEDSKSAQDG